MTFGLFLLAFYPVACLFAFWQGRRAERLPAAIILTNYLMATANYATLNSQLADLCIDAFTAIALLPITMQYATRWLGVIMLVYSLQFGMDAYYLVWERPIDPFHTHLNNANSFLICLSLVAGTALAWTRRLKGAAAAPALAEAAP